MGDWCRCGAYVGITEPHSCSAPPMPSYHELGEAVGALSLILAAQALSDRIESDMWDAWDAEVKRDDEERKAREEESLRREREAWRYVRE